MRNILFFVVFMVVGLSGCVKKSGTSSSTATGSMTATIGSTSFSSTECYLSQGGTDYYPIIGQSGAAGIEINIKSRNITTGTYNFDGTGLNHIASYTPANGSVKTAKSGSVTITAVNVGVSLVGTFSFVCTDGTSITSGSFTAVM